MSASILVSLVGVMYSKIWVLESGESGLFAVDAMDVMEFRQYVWHVLPKGFVVLMSFIAVGPVIRNQNATYRLIGSRFPYFTKLSFIEVFFKSQGVTRSDRAPTDLPGLFG